MAAILFALLGFLRDVILREYPLARRRADRLSRDTRQIDAMLSSDVLRRVTLRPPAGWQAS